MKKYSKLFLSLVIFSFLFLVTSLSPTYAAFMTITSPNGGESYTVGQPVHITWDTDATSNCSLYYITPEGGLYTSYYIGNASASAKFYDWTASTPTSTTSAQQEKVQISCVGTPTDYSDNYFTVSPPIQPVCNKPAQVTFTDTSTPTIYQGGSVSNQLAVTNPDDASCGASNYTLTNNYPSGWSMNVAGSVTVNPGETQYIPVTLISSSTAAYQTYNYSVSADGSSATGYVTLVPRCDATVQATLTSSSLSGFAGDTLSNSIKLTNPNVPECAAKSYIFSYGYPTGWNLSISQNISVNSGQTVTVPFTVTSSPNATVGSYPYDLTVYNAWADGSGQANVSGSIQIFDNTPPSVTITSPLDNSQIARRSSVTISADASDNVGVTKVEFYVNGSLICSDTTSSYSCSFTTAKQKNVSYTLTAKAYDAAGNAATSTSYVTTN